MARHRSGRIRVEHWYPGGVVHIYNDVGNVSKVGSMLKGVTQNCGERLKFTTFVMTGPRGGAGVGPSLEEGRRGKCSAQTLALVVACAPRRLVLFCACRFVSLRAGGEWTLAGCAWRIRGTKSTLWRSWVLGFHYFPLRVCVAFMQIPFVLASPSWCQGRHTHSPWTETVLH